MAGIGDGAMPPVWALLLLPPGGPVWGMPSREGADEECHLWLPWTWRSTHEGPTGPTGGAGAGSVLLVLFATLLLLLLLGGGVQELLPVPSVRVCCVWCDRRCWGQGPLAVEWCTLPDEVGGFFLGGGFGCNPYTDTATNSSGFVKGWWGGWDPTPSPNVTYLRSQEITSKRVVTHPTHATHDTHAAQPCMQLHVTHNNTSL